MAAPDLKKTLENFYGPKPIPTSAMAGAKEYTYQPQSPSYGGGGGFTGGATDTTPTTTQKIAETVKSIVLAPARTVQETVTVSKLSSGAIEKAATSVATGEAQMAPEAQKALEPITSFRDAAVTQVKETSSKLAETPAGKTIVAAGQSIWRGTQQGIEEGLASTSPVKQFAAGTIKTTTGTLAGAAVLGSGLVIHPVKTSAELTSSVIKIPRKVYETVKTQPAASTAGQAVGLVAGGLFLSKGSELLKTKASNVIVRVGSKKIPKEQLFASEVLEGKKTMPLASSTKETIELFKGSKGKSVSGKPSEDLFGLHSTSGFPKKSELPISAGPKGAVGLEDPGLYITPTGKGSPYFLGIEPKTSYKVSFNPFNAPKTKPQVIEIGFKNIKTLPKEVLKEPGFAPVTRYFESTAGKESAAYITKRSTIGQAEIPRQTYLVPETYKSPLTGKNIPKGTQLVTAGTSEIEAVIPKGATIIKAKPTSFFGRLKGYEEYTIYKGRAVPIRRFNISEKGSVLDDIKSTKSLSEIKRYSSYASDITSKRTISAYPSLISSSFSGIRSSKDIPSSIIPKSSKQSSDISSFKAHVRAMYSPSKNKSFKKDSVPGSSKYILKKSASISYYPKRISQTSYVPKRVSTTSYTSSYKEISPTFSYTSSSKKKKVSYPILYKPTSSKIIPTSYTSSNQKKSTNYFTSMRKGGTSYITEVRRRGKFIPIAVSSTVGGAKIIGQRKVLSTLAASFRVREAQSGKYLRAAPSKVFRTAKRDMFTFVQRKGGSEGGIKGGRLATSGEIQEIKQARRVKW